jgi:hypothetical protein
LRIRFVIITFLVVLLGRSTVVEGKVVVTGELKKWHKVTLTFEGPDANEFPGPNPFLDYRLNVFFYEGQQVLHRAGVLCGGW